MTPNRQAEIRAAAERVADETSDYKYWYGNATRCPMADAKLVAHAYLAEHPADDDQPIDETWLRSVGFGSDPLRDRLFFDAEEICIGIDASDTLTFANSSRQNVKTRGDLRRLARALGITLHEASRSPAGRE